MTALDHFQHEPINTDKQQIRLLHVHSQLSQSGRIQGDIKTFDLNSCPPYRALSYVWGSPPPTELILIHEKLFEIRENLHHFLEVFRVNLKRASYIWIDQLCMKQSDDKERNHQVGIMNQIYARAIEVLVWLGPESNGSDIAIRHIRHVSSCLHHYQALPSFDVKLEQPIVQLLTRPYFTRLWIVQEILLATKATVMCGSEWIKLAHLRDYTSYFLRLSEDSTKQVTQATSLLRLSRLSRYSFHDLICRFSNNECVDPRDKVYGLLGILNQHTRPEIDYRKSTEEVFFEAVKFMFNSWDLRDHQRRSVEDLVLLWEHMGLKGSRGNHTEYQLVEFLRALHEKALCFGYLSISFNSYRLGESKDILLDSISPAVNM
jgi:hypothetical protein